MSTSNNHFSPRRNFIFLLFLSISGMVISCWALMMLLVLTTGGTGIALRDVTPEAIRGIMRVEIPGFGETMRMRSLEITPNAILSRSLAAIVDRSLVIALPGKPSGAVECLSFVKAAIPHTVKLAMGVPTSC